MNLTWKVYIAGNDNTDERESFALPMKAPHLAIAVGNGNGFRERMIFLMLHVDIFLKHFYVAFAAIEFRPNRWMPMF